jgi:hypothetical protein
MIQPHLSIQGRWSGFTDFWVALRDVGDKNFDEISILWEIVNSTSSFHLKNPM